MTTTFNAPRGLPPKAHSDIVRKARDLMAAQRTTRDILLDRAEPAPPQIVARKRGFLARFRKKPDPFAVTPAKFDAWAAEIAAYHPARADLWRESPPASTGAPPALDLPGVAHAADKMAADRWDQR